jgi:hypothetical protein
VLYYGMFCFEHGGADSAALTVQEVAAVDAYYSANFKRDHPIFTTETSMSMCLCTAGRKITRLNNASKFALSPRNLQAI